MSRTTIEVPSNNNQQNLQIIERILASHNYKKTVKNGEEYYKCGVGAIVAPKFIKFFFQENKLILQGWVKNFAFGPESDLGGVVGVIPKKSCKKVMDEIVYSINQQSIPQQEQNNQIQHIQQQKIVKENNSKVDTTINDYRNQIFKKLNEK